jgi:replicative DNA helicase
MRHKAKSAVFVEELPHDLDAEKAVLGSVLVDGDNASEIMDILPRGSFFDADHNLIYGAICDIWKRGEAPDLILVVGELAGKLRIEDITILTDGAFKVKAIQKYAYRVRELWLRREMMRVAEKIYKGGFDLENKSYLEEAQRDVLCVGEKLSGQFEKLGGHVDAALSEVEKRYKSGGNPVTGLATGFPGFDSYFGGLPGSALTIVAARPSVGKSSLCLGVARHVAKNGKAVAYFSIEDSRQVAIQRLLAMETGIFGRKIQAGSLERDDWGKLALASGEIKKWNFFLDDTGTQTLESIRSKARMAKNKEGLDLLVVDYLQIMSGGGQESRNLQVAEWSWGLKRLAKEMGVAVIVASQLARVGDRANRPPRLSDLRDSGAIEQDADMVILLHKPADEEEPPPSVERVVELRVEKNRNGPTGVKDMHFCPALTKFSETP